MKCLSFDGVEGTQVSTKQLSWAGAAAALPINASIHRAVSPHCTQGTASHCSGQTCWLPAPDLLTKSTASWLPPACSSVRVSCPHGIAFCWAPLSAQHQALQTPVGFVLSLCPRGGSHLEPCRSRSWQPLAGTTAHFMHHLWLPLGSQEISFSSSKGTKYLFSPWFYLDLVSGCLAKWLTRSSWASGLILRNPQKWSGRRTGPPHSEVLY